MMSSEQLKLDWESLLQSGIGGQKLATDTPVRLYYGADTLSRAVFFLSSTIPTDAPELSEVVRVEHGRREDGNWTVVLTLLDSNFQDAFISLCVELTRRTAIAPDEASALQVFKHTIVQWRTILTYRPPRRLSLSECRGLAAELYYLLERAKNDELGTAVFAWAGPYAAPYDFRFAGGEVREIKAIRPGATSVHISSVEQLDAEPSDSLQLVLVTLNDVPTPGPHSFTIPNLIAKIDDGLANDDKQRDLLREKLELVGFDSEDSYYDAVAFEPAAVRHFYVGPDFPRLLKSAIPVGVVRTKYELELIAFRDFMVNDSAGLGSEGTNK